MNFISIEKEKCSQWVNLDMKGLRVSAGPLALPFFSLSPKPGPQPGFLPDDLPPLEPGATSWREGGAGHRQPPDSGQEGRADWEASPRLTATPHSQGTQDKVLPSPAINGSQEGTRNLDVVPMPTPGAENKADLSATPVWQRADQGGPVYKEARQPDQPP